MNQEAQQESFAGGGGNTTTGFASGTTCTNSGTYRAENKYMDIIAVFAAGQVFTTDARGKACTWVALTSTAGTNKEGDFTSVKVLPGTA